MRTVDELTVPWGVRCAVDGSRLRIDCYWFTFWSAATAAASVFFIVLIVALVRFLQRTAGEFVTTKTLAIFGTVIAGLAYYGVASVVNRTSITLTGDRLRVRNGPLPWFGGTSCRTSDIIAVPMRESEHHLVVGNSHVPVDRYDVYLSLRTGTNVKLLSGFYNGSAAQFTKDAIECHLGLSD